MMPVNLCRLVVIGKFPVFHNGCFNAFSRINGYVPLKSM